MAKAAVVKKPADNLPATQKRSFAARAGAGLANVTADSFAIPFLTVLQKGSPQVDEASGKQIKDATAGMIFETVGQKLFDGKKGVELVQANYRRVFLRWGAREAGGGFKGEIKPEDVAKMRQDGLIDDVEGRTYVKGSDGTINVKRDDRIVDTRVHYMLLIDRKKRTSQQCVLSLASTQVRKSKHLMSVLADLKEEDEKGQPYTPATFQTILKMTTVPEKNDMGTWYGVNFELAGKFDDPDDPLFLAAESFMKIVESGKANVKYDDQDEGPAPQGGKF